MARLAWALAALLLTSGCLGSLAPPPLRPGQIEEQVLTIIVEGTPGLPFEGSYGTPSSVVTVRGHVPAAYQVTTSVGVAATFTKGTAEGELTVRILLGDREVRRRTTRHPYGTVTLTLPALR